MNNNPTTKHGIIINKNQAENSNLPKTLNKITLTKLYNKSKSSPIEFNSNLIRPHLIKNKSPQNQKNENNSNKLEIFFEGEDNKLKIKNFKIGYCELIKGNIYNLKICKKNINSVSNKYREYRNYETNLGSLIDYSNLIKMIIKLRLLIYNVINIQNQLNQNFEIK